jgi:glutathione S-transferase
MYTVVGHPRSRAMRLIWMLEELGQPYEIEGALWTAAKHLKILPEDRRVPAVAPVCQGEFDTAMIRLGERLGEGPWLMGDTFTVPDVLVGHCLTWGEKAMGWPLPPGDVTEYAARLRARPAMQRAGERAAEAAEAA